LPRPDVGFMLDDGDRLHRLLSGQTADQATDLT
jgi:hypothetical protein